MKVTTETTHYLSMELADRTSLAHLLEHIPDCKEKAYIRRQLFSQVRMPLSPELANWLKGLVQNAICDDEPEHLEDLRRRLFDVL
jgi:hypothetical protein